MWKIATSAAGKFRRTSINAPCRVCTKSGRPSIKDTLIQSADDRMLPRNSPCQCFGIEGVVSCSTMLTIFKHIIIYYLRMDSNAGVTEIPKIHQGQHISPSRLHAMPSMPWCPWVPHQTVDVNLPSLGKWQSLSAWGRCTWHGTLMIVNINNKHSCQS